MLAVANQINNLERLNDNPFAVKVVTLDDFGDRTEDDLKGFLGFFEDHDWKILRKPRRGMVQSQREALDLVNTQWTLYVEDDIYLSRILTSNQMARLDSMQHTGRVCGILNYAAGGYDLETHNSQIDNSMRNPANYLELDDSCVWVREERYRNNFWVEFPATYIRTQLLKQCSDFGREYLKANAERRFQIEHGLGEAWFQQGYDKYFFKGSWLRNRPANYSDLTYRDIVNQICPYLLYSSTLPSYTIGNGYNF
jgi:hypothetical protein